MSGTHANLSGLDARVRVRGAQLPALRCQAEGPVCAGPAQAQAQAFAITIALHERAGVGDAQR